MTYQEIKIKGVLESWVETVKPKDDFEKEASKIIISALEKQIPKKPLEQSTDEKTYYKCICESIQKTAYKDGYQMGAERAYCDRCGQAIDWSVEE